MPDEQRSGAEHVDVLIDNDLIDEPLEEADFQLETDSQMDSCSEPCDSLMDAINEECMEQLAELDELDSDPCDSLMDMINEDCEMQMRLPSDSEESETDSLMNWICEEASLQLCGGFSARAARAMMGPLPQSHLHVHQNPSCAEFLRMAEQTRRRLPHVVAPSAQALMICDGSTEDVIA